MVAAVMAVATPFLAACSSEENLAPSRGVAITDAHIVINVEPYGATPTAAKSRAAEAPAVTKPDTVLLANGMRAVVSMEEDAPETQAATRATMDDGHYTIFALDPATGDRITGTKKQLTGTVTGGVFQSDAGSKMILDPGTYKFVCINDAVTDHGTWLEVRTGVGTMIGVVPGVFPTASDAQIGTSTETIDGDDWQVTFLMKHQNARFRLRLVAYTNQLENVVGALATGGEYPVTFKYALDGSNPVVTQKTFPYGYTIAKLTLSNTPAESNATYVKANNFYSNYMYVLPGGDDVEPLLCEGKAYGKSFNSAAPTYAGSQAFPSKTLRNHSYTITYRLLPEALYLFQDGSCGALAEKGSRTPIGIVAREKTNIQQGVAMGLHGTVQEWEATTSPTYNGNNYTTAFANTDDALQDENGYNWTWTSSTDVDGLVKANQQTRYPAFYWASHDPYGVGFGEWYFPGIGEIINVFDKLAKKTNVSGMYVTFEKQLDVITNAFVSAGGTDPINYRCWSSTIYTHQPSFSSPIVFYKSGSGGSGYNYTIEVRPQGARKNNLGGILTFPFVRF